MSHQNLYNQYLVEGLHSSSILKLVDNKNKKSGVKFLSSLILHVLMCLHEINGFSLTMNWLYFFSFFRVMIPVLMNIHFFWLSAVWILQVKASREFLNRKSISYKLRFFSGI